jgi:hypothetical protein
LIKSAYAGAKKEVGKTKKKWQDGQIASSAGHAAMVLGRPAAAAVAAPLTLATDLTTLVAGGARTLGSVGGLAVDGAKELWHAADTSQQRLDRNRRNTGKFENARTSRARYYNTITKPERKVASWIAGEKSGKSAEMYTPPLKEDQHGRSTR